jgi:hypothetical protein
MRVWATIIWAADVALVFYLWRRFYAGRSRCLGSIDALRTAVSTSTGVRQRDLVWWEYAVARHMSAGTYASEAPSAFNYEVSDTTRRLGLTTNNAVRGVAVGLLILLAFMIGAIAWAADGDSGAATVFLSAASGFAWTVALVGAVVRVCIKSLSPLSRLGRRIEAAAALPDQDRWECLTQIARDERSLVHSEPAHPDRLGAER